MLAADMRLMHKHCWLLLAAGAALLALSLLVAGPSRAPPVVLTFLGRLPTASLGRAPRISFGAPRFSDWSEWMPCVRHWLDAGRAACGFACDFVSEPEQADAVLFHGRGLRLIPRGLARGSRQLWVYVNVGSPLAAERFGCDVSSDPRFHRMFGWTATTMLSSSVHLPYGIWDPGKGPVKGPFYSPRRGRRMACVVFSNCKESFSSRAARVEELKRYMDVHVYGSCGNRRLSKDWDIWRRVSESCRFYLSFEGAFCRDYIAERFHSGGLDSRAIPVVFGGLSRVDCGRVGPPRSFVCALDFASVRRLAGHLGSLAADGDRCATYFEWRRGFAVSPRAAVLCGVCTRLRGDGSPGVVDLGGFCGAERGCRSPSCQCLN